MHVCAGAPAVQLERKAWSQPVDAGAISDRGKQQARRSCWAGGGGGGGGGGRAGGGAGGGGGRGAGRPPGGGGAPPPPPPPSQLARPSGPARRAALADADSDPSHPVALSLGRLGT